jgi:zinc/manganese transport system substrate-binding protein
MRLIPLAGATALALVLAGCATPADPSASPGAGGLAVVTVTDVYGDLVKQVGGDRVSVTSLIGDPAQDPHSFEASARDQLAISDAQLIIENGGGYDPFMDDLISASGTGAVVLNAFEESGLGPNEHVWYDLPSMSAFAGTIAETLATLDPGGADSYAANATALQGDIDALAASIPDVGGDVALTEPVPQYLLGAFGMVDVSPPAFTQAIEEGEDVPPAALQQLLDLLGGGTVALLAYNSQTASPETERVRQAAEDAGVPVVEFTELLPDGQTYLSWMTGNVEAIQAALSK